MAKTYRNYHAQYAIELKKALVRLANHRYILVTHMAEALDIHPILIYRWRKEYNDGKWKKRPMSKPKKPTGPTKNDLRQKELELKNANARIKRLERQLKQREEDIDILKKAERFFEKHRK